MNPTSFSSLPHPVQWAEGMMLAPQHFQQNQIYYERLFLHFLSQCSPYYWGIYSLELEPSKLLTGEIAVTKLHAVMPDGLVVLYDSQSDARGQAPLALSVEESAELSEGESTLVHLVVPIRTEGAASTNSSIQRFASYEEEQVSDENTGQNHLSLYRLSPKLELKLGNNIPDRYVRLPLFRLKKEGMYKVDNYLPPMLAVTTETFLGMHSLGSLVRSALVSIRKKANQLAQRFGMDEASGNSALGQSRRQMIYHLVSALPQVEVLLYSQKSHPFELYQSVARLYGELMPLGSNLVLPELPLYKHDNCAAGFMQVLAMIRQILDSIQLAYSTLSFERSEQGGFALVLDESWDLDTLYLELKGGPNTNAQQLVEWMENARVASSMHQKILKKNRVKGCRRKQIDTIASLGITAQNGNVLFEIDGSASLVSAGKPLEITYDCTDSSVNGPESIVLYIPNQAGVASLAMTEKTREFGQRGPLSGT